MRRKHAKIAAAGLLFALAMAGAGAASAFNPQETQPRVYIALGDSVSSGYGLAGYGFVTPPEGRHTSLFYAKLERAGAANEYHNFATSGFTTADVLEMLRGMGSEELWLFRNARVVTLNIGGNNILTPFRSYLADLQVVSGAGNVVTGAGGVLSGAWGVIYEIMSGVESAVSDAAETTFRIGGIVTDLGNILTGFGRLIGGVGEIIAGSPAVVSTWRGSPSADLEATLAESVGVFSSEFREIIEWIEASAPGATIIVNTIYNPIPPDILRVSVPISDWADELIASMNRAIIEESRSRGFMVSDVGGHFSQKAGLMSFNLNPLAGGLSFDIVHPNAGGHELIARLNYDSFARAAPPPRHAPREPALGEPEPREPAVAVEPVEPAPYTAPGEPVLGGIEPVEPAIGGPALSGIELGEPAIGGTAYSGPVYGSPALSGTAHVEPEPGDPAIGEPALAGEGGFGGAALGPESELELGLEP